MGFTGFLLGRIYDIDKSTLSSIFLSATTSNSEMETLWRRGRPELVEPTRALQLQFSATNFVFFLFFF